MVARGNAKEKTMGKIARIRKRDGSIVAFEPNKIELAIYKALSATSAGGRELAADLAQQVVKIVESRFVPGTPGVEDVQDAVEEVLMTRGYPAVAKAYILYRQ